MKIKMMVMVAGFAAMMTACGSEGLDDNNITSSPQNLSAEECSSPEECAVVADILKTMGSDSLNVMAKLQSNEFFIANVLGASEDLADDFVEKNKSGHDIAISAKTLNLTNINFVSNSDQLTPPTSLIRFSRVGFNHAKDQALVEVSIYCVMEHPTLCGGGDYKLYQKVDGHWVLVKQSASWMS